MSGGGDRPGPKGFEIPDLELPPPARASQSSLRAVVAPASGRGPASGTARTVTPFTDDELSEALAGTAKLDLELEAPISRAGVPPGIAQGVQFADDGFELDSVMAPPLAGLKVAPEGRANWPSGVSAARQQLRLDPVEIRVLADYGPPPSFGPLNALYALRVTLRKRALKAGLRQAEQELLLAENARDARLAKLAEGLLPELSQSDAFRKLLTPLKEAESLSHERGRALSATNDEHAAEAARLDAELAAIQRELAAEGAARSELNRTLEAREQSFRRVEARHKRCFIEMRAIEQQAAQRLGPAGGEMPPDLCAQLAPLTAQAEALRPELDQARAAYQASRAEDEARGRAIKQHESRSREVERKKSQLGERFRRQLSVRQEGLGEATTQRQSLLADVGRAVLAARGGVTVDESTLETLCEAESAVLALVRKSELHVRALDTCDDEKVKSGVIWILGALALVGGYFAYRSFSG